LPLFEETVIVDTDWSGNWRYLALNVQKIDATTMTDAEGIALRIYVKVT